MEDINNLFNCSEHKAFRTASVITAPTISREELEFGGGFSTVTGIILVFFINVVVNNEHKGLRNVNISRYCDKNLLWRIIIPILLVSLFPMILLCFVLALAYKSICYMVIKLKDKNFVTFMDSFDVFWCLENDATKSVINVLGSIEADCPQKVLEYIKEKLLNIPDTGGTKKIFYRKKEKYGFFYWRKPDFIDVSEYIQVIDTPIDWNHLDVEAMERVLTHAAYQALPFDGEGLFQILITKQKIVYNGEKRFALIFRVHHSVGDGVSLINFLCETLADKMDSLDITSIEEVSASCTQRSLHKSKRDLFVIIKKLFKVVDCLTNRILKIPDNNSLHGPTLSGVSLFKWIDKEEDLCMMIKAIKDKVEGVRFSDVILAALSKSLKKHFLKAKNHVPDHVTVIIPVRDGKVHSDLQLQNTFSINLFDLPMNGDMEAVGECNKQLRESVDSLINSWFVKLCSILPNRFLRPLMESRHATMVFSNMPGPKEITMCGGNMLKSLIFFTPKNGTTGFGVTAFCYGGVLRIAASVDCALISQPSDLGMILDDVVAEIKRLHTQYVHK